MSAHLGGTVCTYDTNEYYTVGAFGLNQHWMGLAGGISGACGCRSLATSETVQAGSSYPQIYVISIGPRETALGPPGPGGGWHLSFKGSCAPVGAISGVL